ncbi:uncharacterized protein LOC144093616 [Amblyomma americanum]
MEPIFASGGVHMSANGGALSEATSATYAAAQSVNISSWGNVIAANASRARKLARRDDLAAAKVVGIWLGCFLIIFLVVGIPNYIQKKMREAQENSDRLFERRLSLGHLRGPE